MRANHNHLEADLQRLLVGLTKSFTSEEIAEVQKFLDAGEYGVAFETLCGIATEEKRSVPPELRSSIRALAEQMQISTSWWSNLV